MDFRLGLILLLLALATVVEPSFTFDHTSLDSVSAFDLGSRHARSNFACNGQVGDCINEAEEMMMDSEASRRILAGRNYIGYGAMSKNKVPCNRRGQSYYNCNSRGKANPYKRSCNSITKCGHRR